MIFQLNPTIPVTHAKHGRGYAFLVLDYSQEHEMLWTVVFGNGEIWTLPTRELRGVWNISLDRPKPE